MAAIWRETAGVSGGCHTLINNQWIGIVLSWTQKWSIYVYTVEALKKKGFSHSAIYVRRVGSDLHMNVTSQPGCFVLFFKPDREKKWRKEDITIVFTYTRASAFHMRRMNVKWRHESAAFFAYIAVQQSYAPWNRFYFLQKTAIVIYMIKNRRRVSSGGFGRRWYSISICWVFVCFVLFVCFFFLTNLCRLRPRKFLFQQKKRGFIFFLPLTQPWTYLLDIRDLWLFNHKIQNFYYIVKGAMFRQKIRPNLQNWRQNQINIRTVLIIKRGFSNCVFLYMPKLQIYEKLSFVKSMPQKPVMHEVRFIIQRI